jgi:hypothetical protein
LSVFYLKKSAENVYSQVLESLLPLENHLDIYFGVKAKCITETENVVKIILHSVTKQQLVEVGVAHVACKL